jgi:hypothetical protein
MSASAGADAWTALLAHATQLASAARAWGEGADGARLRASVAPLVQLQAVTLAMSQIDRLAPDHRAYARDQAELLQRAACASLRTAWGGEPMPDTVLQAMADARQSIANALYAGLRCLRWNGPGSLVVPAWPSSAAEVRGTLALMEAGTIALAGEVVAWWAGREPLACVGCAEQPLEAPVQVYRRFDASGRYESSATVPLHEGLPAGMPMLVPICVGDEAVGACVRHADDWLAMQRAAGVPER